MSGNSDPSIDTFWSEEYRRFYRARWNGETWIVISWLNDRRDSHGAQVQEAQRPVRAYGSHAAQTTQGQPIVGTYHAQSNPQNHELLDRSYYVRNASFFHEGKVFSMLFTEAAGTTITDYNTAHSALSRVARGEYAYTQIRRFVVVRQKREFCFAVPIFTYGGRATTKRGVVAREHAIAYSYGYEPRLVHDEEPLEKKPICIIMNQGERPLNTASRIYFAIHHPIQYNVKVKDLGYVHPDQIQDFLGYWHQENGAGLGLQTTQDPDVTAEAT